MRVHSLHWCCLSPPPTSPLFITASARSRSGLHAEQRSRKYSYGFADSAPSPRLRALLAISDIYAHWTQEASVVSDALWFEVAEIGAWLCIHGNESSLDVFQSTSIRPATMPTKAAFCDRQRQTAFALQLFDAMCGPAATAKLQPKQGVVLVEAFTAWMLAAMAEYEFLFLHHVAQPLVDHIQRKHRVLPDSLARAAQGLVERGIRNWQRQAPALAMASILLCSSSEPAALHSIQALITETIQLDGQLFPHVHDPVAILSAALEAAPLAVVSSPMVHQLVLLRVVNLALLSPRLIVEGDEHKRLSERYMESLYRSQLSDRNISLCLRMMDACTTEIKAALATNPALNSGVLQATRSRSENEVFRASLIAVQEAADRQRSDAEPVFPADQFLGGVYDAVSVGVRALSQSSSSSVVLGCFSILVNLEFARECCATPPRNELMILLTQRIEDLVEAAPNDTLQALGAIVLSSPATGQQDTAHDTAFGWACLAIGLIMQRKLRVVLFQASESARRDALAVVFAGLYHGLEPLNSFAHRFLGFALSSLGQFVSVYEIFPFYLQETLRLFPSSDVSKEQVASVMGTVFGALYYTNASAATTEAEKQIEATATETRHAMILWALRQAKKRTVELLPVEAPDCADGLYLAELFLEIAKMAPVELLPTVAREMEALVHHASQASEKLLHEVKTRVFYAVSANCEAEKRAWLAAWFLDLSAQYPSAAVDVSDLAAAEKPQAAAPPASRL